MDLYQIDYISVSGHSWLHRVPAPAKMAALMVIIPVLLTFESVILQIGMLLFILVTAFTTRIPLKVYLPLTLYPVVFLAILFLSVEHATLRAMMMLSVRVFAITGAVILFLLTTSFPTVFGTLGRILPAFLVAALFFTYRSIFVISDSIRNTRTALWLRGGINWRHPLAMVRYFGTALGHVIVHAIDTSQRMSDALSLRGYTNRVYYLGDRR